MSSKMTGESKKAEASKPTVIVSKEGIKPFVANILDDCLYNVIHDLVASTHTAEKKLRMQSAAIQAEVVALTSSGQSVTPSSTIPTSASKPTQNTPAPQGQFTTNAAIYDNGKVTLKGNPFKLQKENFCACCKLPRLMFPLTGVGARIPEDLNRSYCTLHPFIQKAGHDIYGNPFPVDAGKTKKEREALRKLERQEKDNTPGSADTGTADADSTTGDPSVKKLMAGGKGATYVPWHTCPNCKRSLLITKFAQHLEKCMGIGGRTARNTAAARLSGINGSIAGSTQGSRMGTPTPSQTANGKRDVDDSDKDDVPPKKKYKKERREKKKDDKKDADRKDGASLKLKLKLGDRADSSKRPPKSSAVESTKEKSRNDRESSQKRERDEEKDDTPKKKMRLTKETSKLLEITAAAQ